MHYALQSLEEVIMREVSLLEVNQNFTACIAEVEAGERLVLTRGGEPVAEIVPYIGEGKKSDPKKEAARKRLLALMDAGYDWGGPYTYDERHER